MRDATQDPKTAELPKLVARRFAFIGSNALLEVPTKRIPRAAQVLIEGAFS